jgi:uncharacterized protein
MAASSLQPTAIRGAGARDLAGLLALNNAHAIETSALDAATLADLLAQAFRATTISDNAALLIALDQAAAYASPNFVWFKQRTTRFVYVDRIVVDAAHRGRGLARRLYVDLFAHARASGHDRVVCEVNFDPPNLGSDAFHAALGFAEVGRARLSNGKTVRYLACALS